MCFEDKHTKLFSVDPLPRSFISFPLSLPLTWSLFVSDQDKFKEHKSQCSGIEVMGEDREGRGTGEIGNCHLFIIKKCKCS